MFGKAKESKGSWRDRFRGLFQRSTTDSISKDELEALLFETDLSVALVERLMSSVERGKARSREEVLQSLKSELEEILYSIPVLEEAIPTPGAILMVGVNGAGKTTAAGRLAKRYVDRGRNVILAAADTFRAGAIEQLKRWGERVHVEVVAQAHGADPASVVYDAWQRAKSKNAVLIADTAGRLHNKQPLVEELKKVVRVLRKDGPLLPHASYLVLDATTGQNAMVQSKEFLHAAPLTGLVVTKLDGTAKGGACVSAALEFSLPIRYLGIGEGVDDFIPFEVQSFAREFFKV